MEFSPQYLAGLFDGEGWVSLRGQKNKKSHSIQCGIGMSDTVIIAIAKFLGVGYRLQKSKKSNNKDMYHLVLAKKETISSFLNLIIPYLIVKKRQAEIMLDYLNSKITNPPQKRTKFEWDKFIECQRLMYEANDKRRGISVT